MKTRCFILGCCIAAVLSRSALAVTVSLPVTPAHCRHGEELAGFPEQYRCGARFGKEANLRQAYKHRPTVAQFELGLDAAPNDLFRRDAINLLRPWAHELDAGVGNDEGLEPVRPQVGRLCCEWVARLWSGSVVKSQAAPERRTARVFHDRNSRVTWRRHRQPLSPFSLALPPAPS